MKENNAQNFRDTIAQLDANRPKLKEVNWSIMEMILNECDFTKCENTLQVMNKFYEQLWAHVVFPLEDEISSKEREVGRLIVEADEWRRKAEALEQKASAGEGVQEQSNKEA